MTKLWTPRSSPHWSELPNAGYTPSELKTMLEKGERVRKIIIKYCPEYK